MILDETLPLQKREVFKLSCISFLYFIVVAQFFSWHFVLWKRAVKGKLKYLFVIGFEKPPRNSTNSGTLHEFVSKFGTLQNQKWTEQDHIGFLEPLNLETHRHTDTPELPGSDARWAQPASRWCRVPLCRRGDPAGNLDVVEVWLFGIKSHAEQLTAPQKGENFPWCLVHEWIDLGHFATQIATKMLTENFREIVRDSSQERNLSPKWPTRFQVWFGEWLSIGQNLEALKFIAFHGSNWKATP